MSRPQPPASEPAMPPHLPWAPCQHAGGGEDGEWHGRRRTWSFNANWLPRSQPPEPRSTGVSASATSIVRIKAAGTTCRDNGDQQHLIPTIVGIWIGLWLPLYAMISASGRNNHFHTSEQPFPSGMTNVRNWVGQGRSSACRNSKAWVEHPVEELIAAAQTIEERS